MLDGGPYSVREFLTGTHMDGDTVIEVSSRAAAYADPRAELVMSTATFDLGDDTVVPPTVSLYADGHIYQQDSESGQWIALDVGGLVSTVLLPLVMLTGTTGVIGHGPRYRCTASPRVLTQRAKEARRRALDKALSAMSYDLVDDVELVVDLHESFISRVELRATWIPGSRGDGVISTRSVIELEGTQPQAVDIPDPAEFMDAEMYLMDQLDPESYQQRP
nr:hypothetical protein GCM10023233_03830 [Brevibacterium otitidis]